jgi:methyltransferase
MAPEVGISVFTLIAVLLIMGGEAVLSRFNERVLRARGAVSAPDDPMHAMMWAYPACFVAMAVEGALFGPAPPRVLAAGLAMFGLSKALKMWVISTLGVRWTFRVLVLPNTPLVSHGPFALTRHPNYIAVMGELVGVAMIVGAPVTGTLSVIGYGLLLRRKIAVEDRALGRQ